MTQAVLPILFDVRVPKDYWGCHLVYFLHRSPGKRVTRTDCLSVWVLLTAAGQRLRDLSPTLPSWHTENTSSLFLVPTAQSVQVGALRPDTGSALTLSGMGTCDLRVFSFFFPCFFFFFLSLCPAHLWFAVIWAPPSVFGNMHGLVRGHLALFPSSESCVSLADPIDFHSLFKMVHLRSAFSAASGSEMLAVSGQRLPTLSLWSMKQSLAWVSV